MKLATDVAGYFEILRKDGSRSAQYPLAKPTLTIGHATTCDIRLQIPGVQAQHCTIREASKQVSVDVLYLFLASHFALTVI
jgi:hypothetical protein